MVRDVADCPRRFARMVREIREAGDLRSQPLDELRVPRLVRLGDVDDPVDEADQVSHKCH